MLRTRFSRACQPRRLFASLAPLPQAGDRLHGFRVLRTKQVPELELTAVQLQHEQTGAQHLHIARDDANNVFSIGFRTQAPDATGVPHILEHTTLCGSQRYPVRDPFFKMLPRTLSNFMNAFTAADHTYYPFATTNAQDYANLLSVYMDATLHPLLKATDFAQEGWRIGPGAAKEGGESEAQSRESEDQLAESEALSTESEALSTESEALSTESEGTDLVFKGVVYNEMKGQMSDAGYLFYIRWQEHMLPTVHNAGGDPQHITELTHERLQRFHAEHYHPSNARLFTYGNLPLEGHLAAINERLGGFSKGAASPGDESATASLGGESATPPPSQEITVAGPVDRLVDAERQYKTSVSWVLGDTADVVESFALGLASALLLDGYGSPLYRGLVEQGDLGLDWSPNTGYDGSAPGRRGLLSIGLTGVRAGDVGAVRPAILRLLQEACARGFDGDKIAGHLHQLELGLKHKTASFGVGLLQRLTPQWFAGVDPLDALAWNETLAALETRRAQDPRYLEGLVERYVLQQAPALTFTMAPAADYEEQLAAEEAARLARKVQEAAEAAGGAAEARAALAEREALLAAEQARSATEDQSCLPSVHVHDIPRATPAVALGEARLGGQAKSQWRVAPTNGLTYVRAVHALPGGLPADLRPLVPLFADAVMRLGTRRMSVEQLEDQIKLRTGGLSVSYHATTRADGAGEPEEGFLLAGMALDRHVPAMLALLQALVRETDFSAPAAEAQVRQLLQASADGVVNDIASAGHSFARRRAEAGLSAAAALREQASGLAQVQLVTELARRPHTPGALADVMAKLAAIQSLALAGDGLRLAVTCGAESVAANTAALEAFIGELRTSPSTSSPASPSSASPSASPSSPSTPPLSTFFPLPYQVYYGALVLPSVPYTHADSAPLQVLAQLLTHKHLHHEIREKGGAYGGGAYASALDGLFGFYAYRDPNPGNSLAVMRGSGDWVCRTDNLHSALDEAKISVFQSLDAPRAVNEEGLAPFLYGISDAMRQRRREQLLDVTPDQVRQVAERYLVGGLAAEAERAVVLGAAAPGQSWREGWAVEQMAVAEADAAAEAEAQLAAEA